MSIVKTTFVVGIAVVMLGRTRFSASTQTVTSDTRDLMEQSDFVGFLLANPLVFGTTGEWRQFALPSVVEPIKNTLPPDPGNPYPWIASDHFPTFSYPTWFAAKGEYLVFLKHGFRDGKPSWNALAAFPVRYAPGADGRIAGAIFGDDQDQIGMDKVRVRTILDGVFSGTSAVADDRALDILFRRVATASALPGYRRVISFEERFAEVQKLAASIRLGTTRSDVEKVFPNEDGGFSGGTTRYVMGSEVIAEVPYDSSGGGFRSPENKVRGPIRVYKGRPSVD